MQYMNNQYYTGLPMEPYNGAPAGTQFFNQNPYGYIQQNQQVVQNQAPVPRIDPRAFETPEIVMDTPLFSSSSPMAPVPVVEDIPDSQKKKRSYNKKQTPATQESGAIVRESDNKPITGEVDESTIFTYQETNGLLHETLGQIDAINVELVQEFNNVRHSRTMKNKYMVLNNLSENIGAMLSNRISTIKEINNCITKSNDMDYKRFKDAKAAQSVMNDDKYIADVYQALMANPQNMAPTYQMPQIDQSILGSGIVRTNVTQNDINNGGMIDAGYLSYVANMTPEQNAMRYENDPNVQQVVVYDASTGARAFQVINISTGEAIPNMPVYDQMFMEEFTLDVDKKLAKSINLNQTLPLVVINDNIVNQY